MNEITKELMCICIRNGAEIWVEKDKIEKLKILLFQTKENKFIDFNGEIINTADIIGIFDAKTMEGLTRRKNGQWQCSYGIWHDKGVKCDCYIKNLKGEELARYSRGF